MAGELEVKKENWIESTRAYLTDIRSEMKRVTWPNRDRVQSTTIVVIDVPQGTATEALDATAQAEAVTEVPPLRGTPS